jgi:tetratricopeptide (TPR) repeat protein
LVIKADDERLAKIAGAMCPKFSDIRTPLNLWWAEREEPDSYVPRLKEFEKSLGGSTPPLFGGWNAHGRFPGNREHVIVLAAEVWKSASDDELVGLLAHELAHEEAKEHGYGNVIPDHGLGPLAFVCNERMTDLMAISKGFGHQLKLSRLRLEKIDGLDPALMSAEEIDYVLAIVGGRHAAELMWQEKYEQAIPQWERYLERFPSDHNAQAEVGRAHWWLNQLDDAEQYLERAHQLDPEHVAYIQELEKLRGQMARMG